MAEFIDRYVIKTNDSLYFVYVENFHLWVRTYADGQMGEAVSVCPNVNQGFSVTVKDKEIYLFCQDTKSNINLCYFNGEKWTVKPILKSNAPQTVNLHFHVNMAESMTMLYNMPDQQAKAENIIFHSADKSGKWSAPVTMDSILPFREMPFYVQPQPNNPDHCIVFYQRRYGNMAYEIGYREVVISSKQWTEFYSLYKSGYYCTDQCFVTTKDGIHSLVVVRGTFSVQLVYQNKKNDSLSNPFIIMESQNISHAAMLIMKGKLHVFFMNNGEMYRCFSEDGGSTFTRPQRHKNRNQGEYVKAVLIDASARAECGSYPFFMRKRDLASLDFLVELQPDFMELAERPAVSPPPAAIEVKSVPVNVPSQKDEQIEILKSRILQLTAQAEEKDEQLFELTRYVEKINQSIELAESEFRERNKHIIEENNELRESLRQMDDLAGQVLKLSHENEELQAEVARLHAKIETPQAETLPVETPQAVTMPELMGEEDSKEAEGSKKKSAFLMREPIDWENAEKS